jgi:hypothetical protein
MTYALVRNSVIEQVGPPALWFDGSRWWDFRPQDPATYAAAGWLPVTDTERPADTATDTFDRSVTLVAGVPTVTWTQRPWTVEELAARTEAANEVTITTGIAADLAVMAAIIAQTNADLKTDPSQEIKDLARAIRRLDRKVARILDATD